MDESLLLLQETLVRRLRYAFQVAEENMTLEAKHRAIATATLPEFLLELAQWIPAGTQEPGSRKR